MQQLLYRYLVLKGRLDLPELGRLHIKRVPAGLLAQQLTAPFQQVQFDPVEVHPSRELFAYIAAETGGDDLSAIASFNEWLAGFKQTLQSGTSVEWADLGSFSINEQGLLIFKDHPSFIKGPSFNIGASIIEQELEEENVQREKSDQYWWIYAIVLLLLGAAAIAYHYL